MSPSATNDLPCAEESSFRSRLGPEAKFRITNKTAAPVRLYWVDYAGKRRSFGGLAPGESALKQSYAGHIWIATDESGHCEAAAVAPTGLGEMRVEPPAEARPGE